MNGATAPTLAAIIVQLVLGLAVFQANPRRKSNVCFLLLSLVISAWLGSLYATFRAETLETAAFYIRQASAAGAAILPFFNLLRLSIQRRTQTWPQILGEAWVWLLAAVLIICFCQTKFFLEGARFSQPSGVSIPTPVPVYGRWSFVYGLYFLLAGAFIIIHYARDMSRASGVQRAELSFILIGTVVTLGTLLLSVLLALFIDRSRLVWFAPFRIVLFSLIIAYGMATRKIMEVGFFLQRSMSYVVLTAYLLCLYFVVWWLVAAVFAPIFGRSTASFAHVTAAIIIAFAMAPARGVSQTLAGRLFVGTRRLDFRATMSKAADILKSVTTLADLLKRFAVTTADAVGAEQVRVFLKHRDSFVQYYPGKEEGGIALQFEAGDPVVRHLITHPEPLVIDDLQRVRATEDLRRVIAQMEKLRAAALIGIFSREHLAGVMLLGPRVSGRIYGSMEQNALQVLCGQLAVAVDNAQLFTEVQNAKIYNETLLENLTTGVIAVGSDGRLTVFNNEAEQITGLAGTDLVGGNLAQLPEPLRDLLRVTLASGERQENFEITLRSASRTAVVRASSSIFHGQHGDRLGALLVLTDITALKRLELQIRRSDRLASLGTLSAGMAHEIKNPLVSIKTFAQLLPERYQDSDFRETFFTLIGHEVDRIDSLVNQLLRFARPAKPLLKPMHVHEVLEKALLLVGHRLYQKDIKLTRSWTTDVDTIRADADQIEQVFLNFFLNAMDAMKSGGQLKVSTEIGSSETWQPALSPHEEVREILRISVQDDGEGIKPEDIPHVFDPFFTTKDFGTGLGLSVVHGIIQEHGGQIEVESELAKGTSFHILLPLVRFHEKVAAA